MVTDEYRFIMGIVGGYLDLEVSAIEEFIIDSEEVRFIELLLKAYVIHEKKSCFNFLMSLSYIFIRT